MTKTKSAILALLAVVLTPLAANAEPIVFDIDFGADGSGTFTVDSSLLDAIPASGLYFSPPQSILSFSANIGGILFDTIDPTGNGGFSNEFAAADGLVSGVTGITQGFFTSSTTAGVLLRMNTCGGLPCNTYYTDVTGAQIALEYTVSRRTVPEPATLAMLGLGLVGLGLARRRKTA